MATQSTEPTNEDKQKVFAKQFGQSLATKIAMIVLRLIRNALLARALGPADRGLFSLITSLPELIMSAGNAGLSNAAAYQAANSRDGFRRVLGNTNALILSISVVLVAVSFYLVQQPWLVNDQADAIAAFAYFIALAIPLMLLKVVNVNLLNVLHRISQVNVTSLLESLSPLLLFLVLWWGFSWEPLLAATWAWFASLLGLAVLTLWQLKQGFPVQWHRDTQRALVSYGCRGHFDTLFQKLLLRIDFLFVSSFIGTEALGYYAMATAAAELLLTIPNSLSVPLFSFFMRKSDGDKDHVTSLVLRVMTSVMVVSALVFAVIGERLIWVLFGEAYLPGYAPLVMLLPGIVFLSYCSLVRLDLLGRNKPGTVSLISGFAVCINVLLNLLWVSDFGVLGVAAASSVAYGIAAIGLHGIHRKLTGMTLRETLLVRPEDIALLLTFLKR